MTPAEALRLLGSTRVIWIDDRFSNASIENLTKILIENVDLVMNICPEALNNPLSKIMAGDDSGNADLDQAVANLNSDERTNLFQSVQSKIEENGNTDLSNEQIESVCKHLSILEDDRWPFEGAEAAMRRLATSGEDATISYIIDLNNAQEAVGNTRGLELLTELHELRSKATALLLTHYANKSNEADIELILRNKLAQDRLSTVPPVCVIAKDRLSPEGEAANTEDDRHKAVAEALRIAIKRAGLRRNVHEVLVRVHSHIDQAFSKASNDLLEIPPEQLDEYVVSRAYAEGVSELHVVERALTASMSESFRQLFSVNHETRMNESRLRELRPITLNLNTQVHHKNFEEFRKREVWESTDLVNKGCSPLACGDVFEQDSGLGAGKNRFILLVQPCDVTLRPKGGRDSEAGFLVYLKLVSDINTTGNQKQIKLPFLLDGKQWICDLRKTTFVRLELLDLVSYRTDGKMEYSEEQPVLDWLLPGQKVGAQSIFNKLGNAIKTRPSGKAKIPKEMNDSRCQLTLSAAGPFQDIAHGTFVDKTASGGKAGFTWNLRRLGRVRMPYASALLSGLLAVADRDAFDLDYLKPNASSAPACGQCS